MATDASVPSTSGTNTVDFKLRAPGSKHAFQKYFLGNFPLGAPTFKQGSKTGGWKLYRQEAQPDAASPAKRRTDREESAMPWVLEDGGGAVTHQGGLEGGLSGAAAGGAGYFLLLKEGADLVALPVSGWYNFRPKPRHATLTLEQAEAHMTNRRLAYAQANPRLAQMSAAGPEDDEEGDVVDGREGSGDEAGGSDEEDRAQQARGAGGGAPGRADGGEEGEDGEEEEEAGTADQGEDAQPEKEKGEDWEHEEDRADDDLDMGDEPEDVGDDESPVLRPRVGSDSDEDDRGLSSSGREMQALLRKTGLDSDSELSEAEEAGSGEEEEDLDAMAASIQPKMAPAVRPNVGAADELPDLPSATKRPAGLAQASAKRKEAASPSEPAPSAPDAKRVKVEAPAGEGVVTEGEVVGALRASGPVLSSELAAKFKRRLKTPEARRAFTQLVKKVAKLEELEAGSGKRFVVLKNR